MIFPPFMGAFYFVMFKSYSQKDIASKLDCAIYQLATLGNLFKLTRIMLPCLCKCKQYLFYMVAVRIKNNIKL